MARTTAEILEQLQNLLPRYYESAEPLLAGLAAAMARAEQAYEVLAPLATVEDGEGIWLSLLGRGLGIRRASGESDESLRLRIRTVEDQVTKPAIKAAVDRLIAPDECQIIEWYEGPFLDDESDSGMWLDNTARLSGGPQSFLVVIPQQSTGFDFGSFLDEDLWLDDENAFIGEAPEDPVYAAIVNEVERIRAAGVFWRLVLEG